VRVSSAKRSPITSRPEGGLLVHAHELGEGAFVSSPCAADELVLLE
jgi:hypothetical protein